jgi:hypothetical protein
MLQQNRLLQPMALAAFLLLSACTEGSRDVSPWSRLLPSESGQSVVAMALDPQGEPAVTGALIDGIDPSLALPDGIGQGVFLTMLSDTGDGLWGGMTAGQITQGRGVAIAPNGDVLLLGTFTGTLNLGGPDLSGRDNSSFPETTFLARYDPRGKLLWSKQVDDALWPAAQGFSLATNANGDAVIGGFFVETILIDGVYYAEAQTGLVASFDADGKHLWSQHLRGESSRVTAVAVDATGAVYAAGSDFGSVDYTHQDQTVSLPAGFITKLSPGGQPLFTTRVNGTSHNGAPYIRALALSPAGEVAFSGSFGDDIIFGATRFSVLSNAQAFVARISAITGEPLWLAPIETSFGQAEVLAVAVDANDRVYATGQYRGDELTIAGLTLGPTSGVAMFLVELDAEGKATDGRIFDHAGQLRVGRARAGETAGARVLAGHFVGQIDLDDQTLTSATLGSSFVARLALPFASHRRE